MLHHLEMQLLSETKIVEPETINTKLQRQQQKSDEN